MKKNYLIKRHDIVNLGYYFLLAGEEELFLNKVNEEFACRVGEYFLSQLINAKNDKGKISLQNVQEFSSNITPEADQAIMEIKETLLNDLKCHRKLVLVNGLDTLFPAVK